MIEIIKCIPTERQKEISDFIKENSHHFKDDVSNYAKGRKRFWLQYEADLTKKGTDYKEGISLPRLWNYCTLVCERYAKFTPELGLVAMGEKGIDWHRDAKYAAFKAVSINLGLCQWFYKEEYSGYKYENPRTGKHAGTSDFSSFNLKGGEVILFNCKNPHSAIPLDDNRISINLWKFK